MARVVKYRIAMDEIDPCPECAKGVGVAVLDCSWIGRRIWLRGPDRRIVGPLVVADCAQREHRQVLERRGWVVDVPYALAMTWSMKGPVRADILRRVHIHER